MPNYTNEEVIYFCVPNPQHGKSYTVMFADLSRGFEPHRGHMCSYFITVNHPTRQHNPCAVKKPDGRWRGFLGCDVA